MKVIWKEFEEIPTGFGHGVEFYINEEDGKRKFVAFLEGYEWYHGSPDKIVIKIRKAADFESPKILKNIRRDIENSLKKKRLWQGEISPLVFAWLNA